MDNGNNTFAHKKLNLFCELCNIRGLNDHDMKIHLEGKYHKNKAYSQRENSDVNNKCGIFVRGFPDSTKEKELVEYFSNFGKVGWVRMGHNYLLLEFTEADSATKVIDKKNHYINNCRLFIQYKEPRKNNKTIVIPKLTENIDDIVLQSIKGLEGVANEAIVLKQILQPDPYNCLQRYNHVCKDIHQAISYSVPYCSVLPFGSTASGLSFSNSDVDVYISGIRKSDKEKEEVSSLHRIKGLLFRSNKFANLFVIPSAKIPILKCIHLSTSISCDINIKNMLGVCNTKLIEFYMSLDEMAKLAMVVLKYWAKVHKLTGQNHLLTNYALTMMFIFFLQQEPYNFPSVHYLQRDQKCSNMQDGWNGGFATYNICFPLNLPLLQLLEGFFSFYADFNYLSEVICPFLGKIMKKCDFNIPENLPDSFALYKKYILVDKSIPLKVNTSICVQDPFEHSRNILSVVSDSHLTTFVAFCYLGKSICKENTNVLYKLFTEVPPNYQKPQHIVGKEYLQFVLNMPAPNNLKFLDVKILKTDNKFEETREELWFEDFVKFINIYFKDFLKMDVVDSEEVSISKKEKTTEEIAKVCYVCSAKYNFWDARKATRKLISEKIASVSTIDQELAITKHLSERCGDFQTFNDLIKFDISLEHNKSKISLTLKKIAAYKKTFRSFANWFLTNLPIVYENYVKDLSKSVTESQINSYGLSKSGSETSESTS